MHAPRKDNTGYALAQLLAGSEGTLGIVTAARLRLVPRLDRRAVAVLGISSIDVAVRLAGALRRSLPSLNAVEFIAGDALELVVRHGAVRPIGARHPAYLLVEVADTVDPEPALVAALHRATDVDDAVVATDGAGPRAAVADPGGAARRAEREGVPHSIDAALPLPRLPAFVGMLPPTIERASPGARLILFGHLLDGNVHVNVLGPAIDDPAVDDAVLGLAVELGGSISAEHGIGVAKTGWLPRDRGRGRHRGHARDQARARPRRDPEPGRAPRSERAEAVDTGLEPGEIVASTQSLRQAAASDAATMPAITVDDITVLPRIPCPDPMVARQRPVPRLTTAPSGFEGEGFPVRRAFAGVLLEELDPFIHLDQMGEVEYAPGEAKGTPWHPHRGFETVTYMLDGVFEHNDSNGGGGVITNGDTQWMTAGAGILHIERPPEWLVATGRPVPRLPAVGQPAADAEAGGAALPGHPRERGRAGVVARRRGAGPGHRRRGRRPRRPGLDLHADDARARDARARAPTLQVPWRADYNALAYVLAGHGSVGAEGRPAQDRASSRSSARATR